MASAVEYTTIQQQIEALQGKGLLFDSKERAKLVLERYGYYNIINSYKEPYQNVIENQRKYIAGTTFEQIYSMFTLDHNLRNSIMAAMLELEECLRAATAEVIAVSFGVDHNDYLKFRNYREKYHVVPPWILFKGTYFSTLINLIKYLKKAEKQHLIRIVLRIPDDAEITEEITTLFQTILFICLDYRNAAAHGGRIYNFQSPHVRDVRISEETIRCFPTLANAEVSAGIRLLLILLSVFKNRQSGNIIHNSLEEQLNRHLGRYPNDLDILSGCIGIAIQSAKYVWVNEKTKIYHSNDFCSGMTDGIKRKLEDVDTSIYYPCKRCIQERNNQ